MKRKEGELKMQVQKVVLNEIKIKENQLQFNQIMYQENMRYQNEIQNLDKQKQNELNRMD